MLKSVITATVDYCWRQPKRIVLLFAVLCSVLGGVAVTQLSLDTDQSHMISPDLPFRKAEQAMDSAFPQNPGQLVAVIDAPSSPQAEDAVNRLAAHLSGRTDVFQSVRRPPEELLFRQHGLLFLPESDLTALADRLAAAQPLIGTLAQDPSLRGFVSAIGLALQGVAHGQMDEAAIDPLLAQLDGPAAAVAEGRKADTVTWAGLTGGLADHDLPQRVLITQPILRYGDLVAGQAASEAIHQAAEQLGIDPAHGMRVRLTGPVAISDANFASVTEGTAINGPLMLLAVVGLIYLAVRSLRIVITIMLSLVAGLALTMFFGIVTVGKFNPISIAFGVMFVGIAVDFAIQFVVRFRHEQQVHSDMGDAMRSAAGSSAAPLSLAAVATAVGFLSFVPTDYTGVSQLGLIAGGGMIIALIVDFTLLPALLALMPPKPLTQSMSLPWAAGDRWLARHGKPVVVLAAITTAIGLALLPFLPLDFNPLHLQSSKSEAVSTFEELAANPDNGVFGVDLLTTPERVAAAEADCPAHPEILRCESLSDFVPAGQTEKLAIIEDLSTLLSQTLSPSRLLPAPDANDLRQSLRGIAAQLGDRPLAGHLRKIADGNDQMILALQAAVAGGLPDLLGQLRQMLTTQSISAADLPPALIADWRSADGRERLRVTPKSDMNDAMARHAFLVAASALDPTVTPEGVPMSIEQSGKVVVRAFIQAGLAALIAIFALLWLLLRKVRDALLVLLPLLVGALLTVIGCVVSGLAINYANIIALPLLLGIGVAFNIYFVINWRNGVTTPLQSPTTRAVLYSALTTGCAFGSLAASPHLGTASMGLLLFLSLALSVGSTFVLLPALFSLMPKQAAD
jgi:hopanoid biosynthesis associated RND transporter like protein HpnN